MRGWIGWSRRPGPFSHRAVRGSRACLLFADTVMNYKRAEEYATEEGGGVLVVASGDAAPLLEVPETTLDGVALAVEVFVECRRSTPIRPLGLAASDLVLPLGDSVRNSLFSQVLSGARVRVRLVGQQPERFGVVGAVRVEQRRQVGVVALPVPARAAASAGSRTCRSGRGSWCSARRGSGRVRGRRVRWPDSCHSIEPPVWASVRAPAECWWARTTVESIDSRRWSCSSRSGAAARTAANIRT